MKFAHTYRQHLLDANFPEQWVSSAISYRQLKKCIKELQRELSSIGLDAETLNLLLKTAEESRDSSTDYEDGQVEKPFQYILSRSSSGSERYTPSGHFHPKLLFTIDDATGEPLNATLSAETKQYLHQLALKERLTDVRITDEQRELLDDVDSIISSDDLTDSKGSSRRSSRSHRIVEVPLVSDSQFFGMLQSELSSLAALQESEEKKLSTKVEELGNAVYKMTKPSVSSKSKSKHDQQQWRQIFQLYLDSKIFFSTCERDPWANNYDKASKSFGDFGTALQKQKLTNGFKSGEGAVALQQFIDINTAMLQNLRFQEINTMATAKILKKFDKHTALGATTSAAVLFQQAPIPTSLARAVCATISQNLLSTVPQLDDYMCPVCFNIAWRPVRLQCTHVFCIRCLIVMQRDFQNNCPLCRAKVVMDATSDNLDDSMATFLKKHFPEEVKRKQKANERAAGIDAYGQAFDDKCAIM